MDSRIYFHQYRRPRYSNPTYVSTNINHSINFFTDQTNQSPSYINHYSNSLQTQPYSEPAEKGHGYSLKPENINREQFSTINPAYELQMSHNSTGRYSGSDQYARGQQRAQSNLSSYGSNSLSMNQNDIYNKQNSKFNIITMQPKQFDTSIRQHPKYTLENKDELYYKRVTDQLQKRKFYEQTYNQKRLYGQGLNTSLINGQMIAGKHTYGLEKEKEALYQRGKSEQNQININPETITNQYKHFQGAGGKDMKHFNPKLLSQMDELISLS